MSTRFKRDDSLLAGWESVPERPPSELRADQPTGVRFVAFLSLLLVSIGAMALLKPIFNYPYLVSTSWGFVFLSLGVGGLLYHAFRDADEQFRRVYAVIGLVLMAAGVILRLVPIDEVVGAWFMPVGVPGLAVGMLFVLAVLRNETEPAWRSVLLNVLGIAGAAMCLVGLVGSKFSQSFLLGEGLLLLFLGLLYLGGFIGTHGTNSGMGYRAGLFIGALGLATVITALLRSFQIALTLTPRFDIALNVTDFFVPDGLILGAVGLIYLLTAVFICSDAVFTTLVRRELLAFFYSPIAYFVVVGWIIIGGLQFLWFIALVQDRAVEEPIVGGFRYINFSSFVSISFLIPIITMRLLSEEKRSGTMEVLLTAPLNEAAVVLSKFAAAWLFFMLAVAPWWLNLVALRVLGETPFDFRPMLSFMLALSVTGAGFLSIGLFFSSITSNQIIAAVLTFAGMLGLTSMYLLAVISNQPWREIFSYLSYIHLWEGALEGTFAPRLLLFHLSVAVFFLFLTTKVLETRRWS